MNILVVSDIHANLTALEAVLAAAEPFDAIWNLGDTVGYGPDPVACLHRITDLQARPMLVGNHDLAAIGDLDISTFNPAARAAAEWTGHQLAAEDVTLLRSLAPIAVESHVTLAHGSPRAPIWEYIIDEATAAANFTWFTTDICLVGHSHLALVATQRNDGVILRRLTPDHPVDLSRGRWIVNPGSVGQPRDGDPRAAYAIFDPDRHTITGHRVAYDITATQQRMTASGLPKSLVARLAHGW